MKLTSEFLEPQKNNRLRIIKVMSSNFPLNRASGGVLMNNRRWSGAEPPDSEPTKH
ncbi:MAG: hypothetical protein LBL39_02655 [Planctomycetaceae bacterium]|nr:hypothetical protein [Planctomycetaceae bacterium]